MPSEPQSITVTQAVDAGLKHHSAGRLTEAESAYRQALQLDPGNADALHLLGVIASQVGNPARAVELIGQALARAPEFAEALINLGNAQQELRRFDAALASYDRALALKPAIAELLNNRGNALKALRRYDEALASFDQALSIRPEYAEASYNRGLVLLELLQLNAAVESFDRAIAARPGYAEAHWHRALALLLGGDFARGWPSYEWRWEQKETKQYRRHFAQPQWQGKESLAGKTILLHAEQGFGDSIQFCRYVRLVADRGARVLLEVQAPLLSLLKNLPGVAECVASGSTLPAFDYHCPLMSLPLAFGTDLAGIPAAPRYLGADAAHLGPWRTRLGEKTMPRIGLVWSGSTEHLGDRERSLALADLIAHLPPGYQYVSLQKELRAADRSALATRPDILHFGDEIRDFSDTAALCELMDRVISVDTSVAHLAGALGVPVWILLPHRPDWRWMLERTDSPWYPSARLFRKDRPGNWDAVLKSVNAALTQRA